MLVWKEGADGSRRGTEALSGFDGRESGASLAVNASSNARNLGLVLSNSTSIHALTTSYQALKGLLINSFTRSGHFGESRQSHQVKPTNTNSGGSF